jgi:hypothetical protein
MNDFKELKQPEGLSARSERWTLYEFLVKDTEGKGKESLDNFALNPPEKNVIIILPQTLGSERGSAPSVKNACVIS